MRGLEGRRTPPPGSCARWHPHFEKVEEAGKPGLVWQPPTEARGWDELSCPARSPSRPPWGRGQ